MQGSNAADEVVRICRRFHRQRETEDSSDRERHLVRKLSADIWSLSHLRCG